MYLNLDENGSIRIPEKYLRAVDLKEGDEIELTLMLNEIIIKKPVYGCVLCNRAANLIRTKDKCICRSCIEYLYKMRDENIILPIIPMDL